MNDKNMHKGHNHESHGQEAQNQEAHNYSNHKHDKSNQENNDDHSQHENQGQHEDHSQHKQNKHGESHHDHHAMMVEDFKKRFFVSLFIMVPILVLSPMIQMFIGVDWRFTGDAYLLFVLSTILFIYGGKPFLKGAVDELKSKNPGMMTLIAFAISVAYSYSSIAVFTKIGSDFFWELATLIVIMLLGHWIEKIGRAHV